MAGLESIETEIERIISFDPGGRGVRDLLVEGDLSAAATELLQAKSVWILTGFVVPSVGKGETDGPPGAMALASGLAQLGISARVVTDPINGKILARAGVAAMIASASLWDGPRPTHVVAMERPGRAADGKCYSMGGIELPSSTDEVSALFDQAVERGIVTIGVGDGGNEIGMGKVRERVVRSIPHGEKIASVVSADRLIVAGTSNWGAWGLLTAMSLRASMHLLPTEKEAWDSVEKFVFAGGVDGRTGKSEASVDGLKRDQYSRFSESYVC